MKYAKTILTTLLLVCNLAYARNDDGYNQFYIGPDEDTPWQEQVVALPAYPKGNEQWADIYISQTYSGKPKIMLDSITINPDKTVHYILNQQSEQGINQLDKVRSVLYQTFCEDGLPFNQKELMERIKTRAMR